MNKEQQQHLPSFFRENLNLNKCLFVTTNSNNFQRFLVTPEFAVGKHQTHKFCNKNRRCKNHIMFYGFDDIQKKLMHLNYDFENVNCPYSYFKFFIILSEKVVCIHGNFLMEPLLLANRHNRIHRSKECVTSLLWRRIGRKKRRMRLTSNNQKRSTTHYSVADEYCSNADCCRDSSIGNFATTFVI